MTRRRVPRRSSRPRTASSEAWSGHLPHALRRGGSCAQKIERAARGGGRRARGGGGARGEGPRARGGALTGGEGAQRDARTRERGGERLDVRRRLLGRRDAAFARPRRRPHRPPAQGDAQGRRAAAQVDGDAAAGRAARVEPQAPRDAHVGRGGGRRRLGGNGYDERTNAAYDDAERGEPEGMPFENVELESPHGSPEAARAERRRLAPRPPRAAAAAARARRARREAEAGAFAANLDRGELGHSRPSKLGLEL